MTTAFRQCSVGLGLPHVAQLRALVRLRGTARTAILLRSSRVVVDTLVSGGFAKQSTIDAIQGSLEALEAPRLGGARQGKARGFGP